MSKIAILADSGCQLEIGQYEDQGIYIVPLCITLKGKTYADQRDMTSLEVFEIMDKEKIAVQTSQPIPGDIVETLEKIKAAGYDEVIGLPIGTGLSSTLNAMRMAAEIVDIPMTIIDTKGTAGNHKYLALCAAMLIKAGKKLEEIKTTLENLVEHSGTIITTPNMTQLKRGGRVTPAVALIANMLKIVPVMELNRELGGKIDTLATVRTFTRAKQTMVNRMVELGVNAKEYHITIEHVLDPQAAKDLQMMIQDKIGNIEIEVRELPAVVGAHMGVGGLGVQYIKKYS
ncbi:MAG: DegV family protein [Erysipelotrichaceae bacterium]|nr:DegV family protein [Erysipelotrichaceae bacterium]